MHKTVDNYDCPQEVTVHKSSSYTSPLCPVDNPPFFLTLLILLYTTPNIIHSPWITLKDIHIIHKVIHSLIWENVLKTPWLSNFIPVIFKNSTVENFLLGITLV